MQQDMDCGATWSTLQTSPHNELLVSRHLSALGRVKFMFPALIAGSNPTLVGLDRLNGDLERLADRVGVVADPGPESLVLPAPTGPRPA